METGVIQRVGSTILRQKDWISPAEWAATPGQEKGVSEKDCSYDIT
ncbi:hypothetical protein GCM10025794_28430 [Massilia kyonggiensis]